MLHSFSPKKVYIKQLKINIYLGNNKFLGNSTIFFQTRERCARFYLLYRNQILRRFFDFTRKGKKRRRREESSLYHAIYTFAIDVFSARDPNIHRVRRRATHEEFASTIFFDILFSFKPAIVDVDRSASPLRSTYATAKTFIVSSIERKIFKAQGALPTRALNIDPFSKALARVARRWAANCHATHVQLIWKKNANINLEDWDLCGDLDTSMLKYISYLRRRLFII